MMANKILEFLKKEQEDKPMCAFESGTIAAALG
jgi:predicted hydrocarbon binding protein